MYVCIQIYRYKSSYRKKLELSVPEIHYSSYFSREATGFSILYASTNKTNLSLC